MGQVLRPSQELGPESRLDLRLRLGVIHGSCWVVRSQVGSKVRFRIGIGSLILSSGQGWGCHVGVWLGRALILKSDSESRVGS